MDTPQLLGLTFVVVLSLILGPYYFLVLRAERAKRDSLRQRMFTGGRRRSKDGRLGIAKEVDRLSGIGLLNTLLVSSGGLTDVLSRTIEQSGKRVTVGQIVLGSACLALGGFLLALRWTGRLSLGVLAALVACLLPYLVLRFFARSRLKKFEEQFPEAVDLIARSLRAGHAFPTGLRLAADELPEPAAAEFRMLHDQQNYGLPMPDALKDFAKRIPIIDARFFVTAVLTQREAGGNLAEVLDNLAEVIRDRFKIKRQLRVKTAHGRITGVVLAGLPPITGALLLLRAPDHFSAMFTDPFGIRMLIVALVLQMVGGLLIMKITNVEY